MPVARNRSFSSPESTQDDVLTRDQGRRGGADPPHEVGLGREGDPLRLD